MVSLPPPVLEHVQRLCVAKRHPAFLETDPAGNVIRFGGDFEHYGIRDLQTGSAVGDQVDFLAGLMPLEGKPQYLPFLQTPARTYADLHLFADGGSDWALLQLAGQWQRSLSLPLGARLRPLESADASIGVAPSESIALAVVGAHLQGMPLHYQLSVCGAQLRASTHTAIRLRGRPDPTTSSAKVATSDTGRLSTQ